MNERVIFDAAIEIADAEARLAFIEKACVGNPAMLEAVKSLLKSHDAAGSFLDMPVREQIGQANPEDSAAAAEKTRLYRPDNAAPEDSDDEIDDDSQPDLSFLQTSSKPGSIGVLAHYEVLSVLGQGAFGIVFKAFDEKLHRLVAIKVMNPQLAATSPPRKRFLREARAAAAIRHENVVQVYSVEEQPLPYLVMEFIDGQTLKDKLDGAGPLETSELLHIGRQIASGLAAAQTMGLIHRDIKPANILLEQGAEQRVKISDFGLARAADDASLTQSGTIAGTPMYMAPEQATGQALDHRADLFSFGSVLYQMACGRPPFRASNTVAVLRRVVEDTPRPLQEILPEIPDWLVAIVTKLHAKKPEDRFQTAKEVADLLARCQSELQLNGKVTCVAIPNVGHVSNVPAPLPVEPNTVTKSIEPAPISEHVENVLHEKRRRPFLIAVTVIGIAVLAGVMIKPWHKDSTVTEFSKPQNSNSSSSANPQPPTPNPSSWHGWPSDAPPPAIAPFDAEQAKQHQSAWAKYLGVPVEYTNSLGMKFRLIPPGEFLMGSTPAEIEAALMQISPDHTDWRECVKSEAPQHKVVLTQPFYFGIYELTQAEYEKLIEKNPSKFAATGPDQKLVKMITGMDTTHYPVENVNWNEAVEFCAQLSKQEKLKPFTFGLRAGKTVTIDGTGYRLPTEAEWEFACRAGTTTKYWIGDKDEDFVRAGWFGVNSDGRTHAAGALKGNPFGLYDTHGNVWEWVQDGWEPTYYGEFTETPAFDPHSPFFTGSRRLFRGGNFFYPAHCRSSARNAYDPTAKLESLGFRVALSVDAVRQALKVDGPKIVKLGVPVGPNGNPVAEQGRSAWDDLDPAQIPEAERVPRQPEGLVAVLGQHRRRVWSVPRSSSVSPDGTQFTLTTEDGLYLFGRAPKQPARFFNLDIGNSSAALLSDGRIAACVSDGGPQRLQIFAIPRDGMPLEKLIASSPNYAGGIQYSIASSDGHWLAGYEMVESLGLWRLSNAEPQRVTKFVLPTPHGGLSPGSFSPDAHWFCFTDQSDVQSAVHLIDLRGDTPREATVLKADADEKTDAPAKGFEHATFLSDGRMATADRNGRIWFWKINDGELQRVGSIRENGQIFAAAKSLRMAAIYGGAGFRVWDLAVDPPQLLGSSSLSFRIDNIQTLAIAPDGETILTSHQNGAIRFWNVSQARVTELDPLVPNARYVDTTSGLLKVVNRFLCATSEAPGRIRIWQPTSDGLQAVPEETPAFDVLGASTAQRQLIVREAGAGGTALLRCDADRVTPTRRITGGGSTSAALNDKGRRLAIARHNGTEHVVELWGWESDDLPAKKLTEVKLSPDAGIQLAFAEAGRSLVGRVGNRIQIWDVKDDQLIPRATLPPKSYLFSQFAVAPDGQTFATVGGNALELWNLKSDLTQPTTSFAIPWTTAVAFSPDGRRLAASFWENGASAGVQIINLATGVVEKRLTFPGRVHELTFTDDSRHLITGNANATIYVVRLEPAQNASSK